MQITTLGTGPRGWLRRAALLLAAFVTGLGVTAVVAAPAQAATGIVICFKLNGVWNCIELPYAYVVCPGCPDFGMEIITDPVLPERVNEEIVHGIGDGFVLLGQAKLTRDPVQARLLREQALHSFVAVGAALDGARLGLGQVGIVVGGELSPEPTPWLEAAGGALVAGVRWVQVGDLSAAQVAFDEAYDNLASPRYG